MTTWYTTSKASDLQGLVCDEETGKNIAVTYNVEHAPLVAAAPELLEALENLEAVESSPHSETVRFLAREQARAAIAKARGG